MSVLFRSLDRWRARRVTGEDARRRAGRGAAYLDAVDPTWFRRVDRRRLRVGRPGDCVLSQLYGSFLQGLHRAHLQQLQHPSYATLSPVQLGFLCRQRLPRPLQERDYGHLNAAWQEELAGRWSTDEQARVDLLEHAARLMTKGDPA